MAKYIDQAELHDQFVKWLTENPDGSNMPEEIGRAILLVANNTIRRWNFSGYTADWREEMVDEAVMNAVKYSWRYCWDKDTKKHDFTKFNNPFAYLSMVAFRSFTTIIRKRKRLQERKFEMIVNELESIQSDEQFAEIDPHLMNDFYYKANMSIDERKTDVDKVIEWLEAEGGLTDFIDGVESESESI